jgi:hypothetical protein
MGFRSRGRDGPDCKGLIFIVFVETMPVLMKKKSGAFNFFYNRTSLYSKRKMERQGLLGTIARKNGTKGIAAAG